MEVLIEKLDNFGRGITYINNKICFVKNALPKEIVEIKIVKENNKYIEAEQVKIINKSEYRIEEECPYSKKCGGCQLNHMTYSLENTFKEQKVKEILKKYANIDEEKILPIKTSNRDNYRNKITIHSNNKVIGLYQEKTNNIVEINNCLISDNKINEIISKLQLESKDYDKCIIHTENEGKNYKIDCNIVFKDKELSNHQNNQFINRIGKYKYYISNNSFFQVNQFLTEELYNEILKNIKGDQNNNVLDLYCGTGTIGIYVSKYCKKIIGVDYNKSNIDDANKNKKLNNINNIEFICEKVENEIDKFNNIDTIIVDPPRAGLDKKTINYIKKINPSKLIYTSCDVVTLARDLNELQEKYKIIYIQPFNMFPRTYHCESVCVLERR